MHFFQSQISSFLTYCMLSNKLASQFILKLVSKLQEKNKQFILISGATTDRQTFSSMSLSSRDWQTIIEIWPVLAEAIKFWSVYNQLKAVVEYFSVPTFHSVAR